MQHRPGVEACIANPYSDLLASSQGLRVEFYQFVAEDVELRKVRCDERLTLDADGVPPSERQHERVLNGVTGDDVSVAASGQRVSFKKQVVFASMKFDERLRVVPVHFHRRVEHVAVDRIGRRVISHLNVEGTLSTVANYSSSLSSVSNSPRR